jgi:hypothetical protein
MNEYIGYHCYKIDKAIITVKFDSPANVRNKNISVTFISEYFTIISIEDFDGNELLINKYHNLNILRIYMNKNNLYMDNLYEVIPDL